ncbi:hypothetical protein [Treponema sp.]|uniref:hypothetical protein n=1 Tax=Treponema sp. TaxID=166 RepID=UPI00298E2AE4|nr:hypothetical protein [Treponema sp.]MCQ2240907.1 hypothetical protein [Treponema sp.]
MEKLDYSWYNISMEERQRLLKQGCINIWIDEIVPCLKDTVTGEMKETVVFKIESRSYLKQYTEQNGWQINWIELPADVEVYELALKDTKEIQGLVAVKNDVNSRAAFLHWACTAPQNNKHDFGKQKYSGVGGHLFAIAADKSVQWGYEGAMHGFALNKELLEHYMEKFNAEFLGMLHDYQFFINENDAKKLLEVYNYEWN